MIMPAIKGWHGMIRSGNGLCLIMTVRSTVNGMIERSKVPFMGPINVDLPSLFLYDQIVQVLKMTFRPKLLNTKGPKKEKVIFMRPIMLG